MKTVAMTLRAAVLACASLAAASGASAALFEDDEARRAILELRQRVEQNRAMHAEELRRSAEELRRANEDTATLRRSILDLQREIETLRGDLARVRGENETVTRALSDVQRSQKDLAVGLEDRLRKFEPAKVSVDGREFTADPNEQREFDAALASFRKGEFPAAQTAFASFVQRYPGSGYRAVALFWLGNAQYANRDYRGAILNFRALLSQAPDHPRAPEAVLSIANCQIELKENAQARRTLDELVKAYPHSEAAVAAKERLARLRS
ncbi:tol-pal system protein YbgF [Ramlibacter sp.]|uniref:tol-pal system protein YbgF n=1 Tax=Ramlibacter sp. TaxID=1917967 RepID=UPI003D127E70